MLPSEVPSTEQLDNSEVIKKNPEIIANPRLDNLKLVISVPTYHGEWKNGVLMRNLIGVLSQNMQNDEAVEVNYVFNMDNLISAQIDRFEGETPIWKKRDADDPYWEKRKVADEAIEFLKKVVQCQSDPELAKTIVDSTTDLMQKKLFELAALKKERVAVSVVNTLDTPVEMLGYRDNLSGHRTLGLDYGEARLDDDGAFLLFDTDAVPDDNQFAHNVNSLFKTNPDTKYMILRLGHQPSGYSKELIESSPEKTFDATHGYSTRDYSQTAQMAFRKEVIPRLKEVIDLTENHEFRPSKPGQEDRDTAFRLIGLYADMNDGMMYQVDRNVGTLPVSLVEDRVDGLFDAGRRAHSLKVEQPKFAEQIANITQVLESTKASIVDAINKIADPELQAKLRAELDAAKSDFLRKQQRNIRFNRAVIKDFLTVLDQGGEVKIGSHDWLENDEVKKKLAEMPNGTALLSYLTRNKELIDELTPEDLSVMKYCVSPSSERPALMDDLNDFQKTLIEYIGYVGTSSESAIPAELQSQMQPLLVELLAYSHVYSLHQLSEEFYKDDNEDDYGKRLIRERREDITEYKAVQEGRDKSWLGVINKAFLGKSEPPKEEPEPPKKGGVGGFIQAVSPRFWQFLEQLSV